MAYLKLDQDLCGHFNSLPKACSVKTPIAGKGPQIPSNFSKAIFGQSEAIRQLQRIRNIQKKKINDLTEKIKILNDQIAETRERRLGGENVVTKERRLRARVRELETLLSSYLATLEDNDLDDGFVEMKTES